MESEILHVEKGVDKSGENAGFIIDNDQKAEWALKKIAEVEADFARLDALCNNEIEFYRQKQEEYKRKRDIQRSGLVGMLAQYFERIKPRETKTQSVYELPHGRLIKKFEKAELKFDEEKLLESLKDTEFVASKPVLKWGDYKKTLQIHEEKETGADGQVINNYKVVDINGEIVESVIAEVKPASFTVEVI